jgi:hypothetical protein
MICILLSAFVGKYIEYLQVTLLMDEPLLMLRRGPTVQSFWDAFFSVCFGRLIWLGL